MQFLRNFLPLPVVFIMVIYASGHHRNASTWTSSLPWIEEAFLERIGRENNEN
jgi:hypothetical protein